MDNSTGSNFTTNSPIQKPFLLDDNWIWGPYLAGNPWKTFATVPIVVLICLYIIFFRLFFRLYNIVFHTNVTENGDPIHRFLWILNCLNLTNAISSIVMVWEMFFSKCDNIFTISEHAFILVSSALSDCTYRSAIWILIVASFNMMILRRDLIDKVSSCIILWFFAWSIAIRTVTVRYEYTIAPGYSCVYACCKSGSTQIVPADLKYIFNLIKAANELINLLSVILMIVLIPVLVQQMRQSLKKQLRAVTNHTQLLLLFVIMTLLLLSFNFLNPVFKKMQFNYISESIHNLAIWTPVLTVTCHILQIIATMTVLPNYRQIYWQEYCQKPASLC